jgi:hypothetical protein
VHLGTLSLDPPMILRLVSPVRRVQRASPAVNLNPPMAFWLSPRYSGVLAARTRRVRRRERHFRDSRNASRVPIGTLNVLMGTHGTSGHVPKTPFAGTGATRRPAKRASPAGQAAAGRTSGGFRLNAPNGPFAAPPMARTDRSRHRAPWHRTLRVHAGRCARRPRSGPDQVPPNTR